MKILYSPQRSDASLTYRFDGDIITVYYDSQFDTFDFTGLPDGKLQLEDEDGNSLIETSLPINPIKSAHKKDGVLHIELLYYHSKDATEKELFPKWTDVDDLEVGLYNGEV